MSHTLASARKVHAELMVRYKQDPDSQMELQRIIFARQIAVNDFIDNIERLCKAYRQDIAMAAMLGKEASELGVLSPDLEHFARIASRFSQSAFKGFMEDLQIEKATGQDEYALLTDEGKKVAEAELEARYAAEQSGGGLKELLKKLLTERANQGESDQFPIGSGMFDGKFAPDEPTNLGPIGGTGPTGEGEADKKAS